MTEELDVLRIISERLRAADVPFMLKGSFALGYYGKPRMTRDLDPSFVDADILPPKGARHRRGHG